MFKPIRGYILLAALMGGVSSAAVAQAQSPSPLPSPSYPTKPVRLLVGFPPGGGTDLFARTLAPALSEGFGQQVVVENRAGAQGNIGVAAVAIAAVSPALLKSLEEDKKRHPAVAKELEIYESSEVYRKKYTFIFHRLQDALAGKKIGVEKVSIAGMVMLGEADGTGAEQDEEEGGGLHGLENQRAVPCVIAIARICARAFSYSSRAAT